MAAISRTLIPVNGNVDPDAEAFVVVEGWLHKLGVEHAPPYAVVAGDAMAAGTSTSMKAQTSATVVVLAAFMRYPQIQCGHAPRRERTAECTIRAGGRSMF
jgi:hypothetical protein